VQLSCHNQNTHHPPFCKRTNDCFCWILCGSITSLRTVFLKKKLRLLLVTFFRQLKKVTARWKMCCVLFTTCWNDAWWHIEGKKLCGYIIFITRHTYILSRLIIGTYLKIYLVHRKKYFSWWKKYKFYHKVKKKITFL
jgi:hypothetical protein